MGNETSTPNNGRQLTDDEEINMTVDNIHKVSKKLCYYSI